MGSETMLKPTDRVVLVLGILQLTLLTPLDPRAGGLLVVRVALALFSSSALRCQRHLRSKRHFAAKR